MLSSNDLGSPRGSLGGVSDDDPLAKTAQGMDGRSFRIRAGGGDSSRDGDEDEDLDEAGSNAVTDYKR